MIVPALADAPLLFVEGLRDWVIIIWGIASIALLLSLVLFVIMLVVTVKRLIREVEDLMNTGVRPLLASARESADNVTGTTRFLGDKVVSPLIRVISIVSGIRRGIALFGGLTGRGKQDEERNGS